MSDNLKRWWVYTSKKASFCHFAFCEEGEGGDRVGGFSLIDGVVEPVDDISPGYTEWERGEWVEAWPVGFEFEWTGTSFYFPRLIVKDSCDEYIHGVTCDNWSNFKLHTKELINAGIWNKSTIKPKTGCPNCGCQTTKEIPLFTSIVVGCAECGMEV